MRTLTEKYNGVLKGLYSKEQFLRDARQEQPRLVTQYNNYKDAVQILKQKSLITNSLNETASPHQLDVVFKDPEDYIRAKQWFDEESAFYPSSEHDEFLTLSFEVADQSDADATERAIDQELLNSDIQSWYFRIQEDTVNESSSLDLQTAIETAKRTSEEEGVVQHVNELPDGGYTVSDWYDYETTVRSFEFGMELNESTKIKENTYINVKPNLPLDVLDHAIRFELDKKGKSTDCTVDEYEKAFKTATKNLEKDLLFYKKAEGAKEMPVSKTDQMVKAKLKEGVKYLIRKVLADSKKPTLGESVKGRTFTLNGKLK
jgi:hypothetical protein